MTRFREQQTVQRRDDGRVAILIRRNGRFAQWLVEVVPGGRKTWWWQSDFAPFPAQAKVTRD